MRRVWTDDVQSSAISLRGGGKTDREIAETLGISRRIIAIHLGSPGRSGPPRKYQIDSQMIPPTCKYCCCCIQIPYYDQSGNCTRFHMCNRCSNARAVHGFSSHLEYDCYLAKGCWVCGAVAVAIDHDHGVGCPSKRHSCERCRRGPICSACNFILRDSSTVQSIQDSAIKHERLAKSLRVAADALTAWNLEHEASAK